MPFDSSPEFPAPAAPQVEPALSPEHARLLAIARMLESDQLVRDGWNFETAIPNECGSDCCAIGWAGVRGILKPLAAPSGDADALGMDMRSHYEIFYMGETYGKRHRLVTPDDVASRIRAYLAERYPALRHELGGGRE